jgi:dienelactone hydrolase
MSAPSPPDLSKLRIARDAPSAPLRKAFGRSVTIIGVALAALGAAAAYLLRDPLPYFLARRSSLSKVAEGAPFPDRGYELRQVRLTATSGLSVELTTRRAVEDRAGPLPLVVVLGGHHTGRDAVRLLGDTRGTFVAAMSYPFTGDPRPETVTSLREIPKIRTAFLDTPPALMLALDYLLRRPDVDRTRVEAVGVSLGAPFVSIAGALDPRFTRGRVLHGSGGSFAPLEMNMRRTIRFAPLRWAAAAVANVIIAGPRLAPEHWVPRIAPRPFVMVSAEGDERLPREAVEKLFRAAREPKTLIWMPGEHVHADTATSRKLAEIVLARVRRAPGSPDASARLAGEQAGRVLRRSPTDERSR